MRSKLRVLVAAAMASVFAVAPALANSCGCRSATLTYVALSNAEVLAPAQAAAETVRQAEGQLDKLLVEYAYQFNQNYTAMSVEQRKAHYALLNDLRVQRIALVEAVRAAYAAAGAPQAVLDVLDAHAAILDVTTADTVKTLQDGTRLLIQADASDDTLLRQAAAQLRDACTALQSEVAACLSNAVANSDSLAAGHLTQYAWVSGPALILKQRLQQLQQGAQPVHIS